MADKPFRVLLDLTDLHLVNFKYVWINVSPRELKTISDFKMALLHKINLDREDIKLFLRDGLLLEQETIIVLREDDTIKVQYEELSQLSPCIPGKESQKRSRKRNCRDSNMYENNESLNKRRCKSTQISDEFKKSSKKEKKRKNSVSLIEVCVDTERLESNHNKLQYQKKKSEKFLSSDSNATEPNQSGNYDSFFSFDASNIKDKQHGNKTFSEKINPGLISTKESLKKTNSVTHQEIVELDTNESFSSNTVVKKAGAVSNCPKKKRKRHKKRKHTESVVTDISNCTDSKFPSVSENADEDNKRKHIIYSPVRSEKDSFITCGKDEVQDSPKDTFVVNKNNSTVDVQFFKDYPKISTPVQSDVCGNPSWHISLNQNKNSAQNDEIPFHEKEITQNKPVVKSMSVQNFERNTFPSETHYNNLPPVTSIPKIGTCIVYKALELDENYSPIISEYREGVVKNINPDTEEIEIELLKHIIKPGKTGKFEVLNKDEVPAPEIKKCEILRWSDIISPKKLT